MFDIRTGGSEYVPTTCARELQVRALPIGSIVVPFRGLYLGSCKAINPPQTPRPIAWKPEQLVTLCFRGPNYWVLKGSRVLTIRSLEA